jgi:hypothetical protein
MQILPAGFYRADRRAQNRRKAWKGKSTKAMKYAGLPLMPAGFFLTIAALVLFPDPLHRGIFILCALAVECAGLGVAVRGHMPARGTGRP